MTLIKGVMRAISVQGQGVQSVLTSPVNGAIFSQLFGALTALVSRPQAVGIQRYRCAEVRIAILR